MHISSCAAGGWLACTYPPPPPPISEGCQYGVSCPAVRVCCPVRARKSWESVRQQSKVSEQILCVVQPQFARGMMTAFQYKKLLENEEAHNVIAICGASTCKAYKGCNQQEFATCLSMNGLERKR